MIITHLPNHSDLHKQCMQWDSRLLEKCKAWSLSSMVSSSPLCTDIPIAFQFSQTIYTVTRGETAELVMTTSDILTFDASVILMASGGNATAGKYTINWSGQSTHCMKYWISCDPVWYVRIKSCYLYIFATARYIVVRTYLSNVTWLDHFLSNCFLCLTAGEDYTAANPLVVPLELCGNKTLVQIPTIADPNLLDRSTEYFTVEVVDRDVGLETITTSVTVVIVEPTGGGV